VGAREWAAECMRDGAVRLYILGGTTASEDLSRNNAPTSGVNSPNAQVNSPWGKAIRLVQASSQRLDFSRYDDTTGVASEFIVRTTSTDATCTYDGCAANNLAGDLTGSHQHNIGVHGGKVRFLRYTLNGPLAAGWEAFDGATSMNDGRWHQVGAAYNSTSLAVNVILDGKVDGSGTATAHRAFGGYTTIGCGNVGGATAGDFFDGDIALAAIFADDIPAGRFAAHYRALNLPPPRRMRGRR
jgi:hypothetical protein